MTHFLLILSPQHSFIFSNKLDFVFPTDETTSNGTTVHKRDKHPQDSNEKSNGRVWTEFTDIKQVVSTNSLQDMWNRKQQEKRAPEFDGRAECPPPRIIPLYVKPVPPNPPVIIPNVLEKS